MDEVEESKIRKLIWERKDAVDAKMSEAGFSDLTADEQDAWVLSLQLGLPFDAALACANGTADAAALANVRGRAAEAFKYGKRKALRTLKDALSRHEGLKTERTAGQ